MPAREFELVVLCTGNRFRSPIAAAVLRERLQTLPVRVRSLGTLELGAIPVLPEALELAANFGLDLSAHRARCLVGEDLSGADLVVGFERDHVVKAVVEAGAPRERTFTLPDVVAYLDQIEAPTGDGPVESARAAVARAGELQAARRADPAELADPIGGTDEGFRRTAAEVRELAERLARALFG